MDAPQRVSLERAAFGGVVASLLAPVIAHGLWRPLAHVAGTAGSAVGVTGAALAVAAAVVLAQRLRPAPWLPPLLGGLAAAAASGGLSLGLAGLLSLLAVDAAIAWLVPWLSSRLPDAFDGLAAREKPLTFIYALAAAAAVASVARLSVFIGDPTRADMQALPGEKFVEVHSCLTAYVRAASLARRGVHNLYADHWWHGSNGLPPLPAGVDNPYVPFGLDNFSYPPPFLLIVSPLGLLEGDFYAQRALWFGLNGLLLAIALWHVARFVDGPRAHRALLLAPLFFGSVPVLVTLQIGNFHLAAVALSLVAMVAIERGRAATGGAALALAILSKISPGILGVGLLLRRQYRPAAFAASFGALFLALAALRFGVDPLASFVTYALPRLSSGAAFPFMGTESGIVTNMAPFGFPFKLRLLGLDLGDPWRVAPVVARAYTLALVGVAVVGSRRRGDRRDQAMRWMGLLVLAALQSPFSAAYALIGLLWATTLLAVEVRGWRGALCLVALWPLVLVVPPWLGVAAKAVESMAQTCLTVAVSAWLVIRAPRGEPAPAHASRTDRRFA